MATDETQESASTEDAYEAGGRPMRETGSERAEKPYVLAVGDARMSADAEAERPPDGLDGTQAASEKDSEPIREEHAAREGRVDVIRQSAAGQTRVPETIGADAAKAVRDAADERAAEPMRVAPGRRPVGSARHAARIVLIAVVLVVVALASFFAWDRWGRYDDHADMQGEWYVEGTAALVTIDDSSIHLSDAVAYDYELDERAKTITFTFGGWDGQGRYRFGNDRQTLVIADGEFDGVENTVDDLQQTVSELAADTTEREQGLTLGDGAITLSRRPDALALAIKRVHQKIDEASAPPEELEDEDYYDYYE